MRASFTSVSDIPILGSVSYGDPKDEVRKKVPGVDDRSAIMKGDFWEAPCLLGFWQMEITYDAEQHVISKQLNLYVGTHNDYLFIPFL